MTPPPDDVDAMAGRYARRAALSGLYDPLRPEVMQARHERQRVLAALLGRHARQPLAELRLLEVGCGGGANLLELIALVYEHREASPVPLRQVIAESLHADSASLSKPMAKGSGVWLHVAIALDEWVRPSPKPWATSCAPRGGRRQYVTWRPA
jgi:hypothetical protein